MTMNHGEKGRSSGLEYERTLVKHINTARGPSLKLINENKVPSIPALNNKLTTSKTDITSLCGAHRISVKNPKNKSASIQIFIASGDRLLSALDSITKMPREVNLYFSAFHGFKTQADLLNFCAENNIDPNKLSFKHETRRHRLLHGSMPKSWQSGFEKYINSPRIKKFLLRAAFMTGFCRDEINHANCLLWAKEKGSIDDITFFPDISKIIKHLASKEHWNISKNQSVWHLGPVTWQMKGSGPKSQASYHSPQFNSSLSRIKKFIPNCYWSDKSLQEIVKSLD